MTFARDERLALVDSMAEFGPDAPTLCGTWTNRDLAAHLIVRERRLDTTPGILVSRLAGYTERVQNETAMRPWSRLLDEVRTGPPRWSPMYWVDAQVNMGEMFVHHEDVRRAHEGWEPRVLPAPRQDALWGLARKVARLGYRSASVTVVLARPSGEQATVRNAGTRRVILRGEPAELVLHAFGRDAVRIETEGDAEDAAAVMSLDRSF
ncbi:TIGR03085 family metal-binding protein [Rhodococcus tibetensis]|uniref:TIGR03085 family metal-binding protein n=1 Tax=Rhodococcus tibetensis TaxID=2965064 RepID=A0ABT1QAW8_9NOCA|nr:TIGR03085 family metal-binding protein [Rhodococcus sp. FXJ9.536]MCQ4119408.1 TIGR03085 family metal-binding protein [Rhodococcus sp. FXJ9.536]